MKEEPRSQKDQKEAVLGGASDFEARLSKVLEQDGAVMSTPSGVKKLSRPVRQASAPKSFLFVKPTVQATEDDVAKLDMETVACVVRRHEPAQTHQVRISQKSHERSPFVVSLRDCMVAQESMPEDRVSAEKSADYAQTLAVGRLRPSALDLPAMRGKVNPLLRSRQMTGERNQAWGLSFKLWWSRFQMAFKQATQGSAVVLSKVKQEEEVVLQKAGQELEAAAEEVAQEPFSYGRAAVGFLVAVALITLPAHALVVYRGLSQERSQIESQGEEAVASLAQLSQASSLDVSLQDLQNASGKFKEVDRLLDESRLLAVTAAAVVPKQYQSAKSLLEVGSKMSQAGQLLAMGFSKVFDDPDRGLIERLEVLGTYSRAALPLLADAESAARNVDLSAVPAEQKDQASSLPDKIGQAKKAVREFAVLADAMVGFLGKDRQRTYLLVFQNQTELRPSGGFMGSIAEITVDQGKIISLYVPKGGTYDLQGQLTALVAAPKPLQLVRGEWQFQDANWFPDFPKTAEKIRWLWSKSGQPTLDGVIAINASFMEQVLQVTGPIDMPEYDKTITADNFLLETQKAVELEYDKEANTPKKFIGDLFAKLMDRAKTLDRQQWLSMAFACSQALDTKDIQIAMYDPAEEKQVEDFGWQGRLKPTPGDSLAVIEANIAGQKTDAVVQEKVDHQVDVQSDGSIIDTVTLVRTHTGQKGELFRGVRNVEYLRIYVPKGSELLAASGFDPPTPSLFKQPLDVDGMDPDLAAIEASARQATGTVWSAIEDDRTVFGGWLQLDPGHSQQVVLRYRLPFTVSDVMAKVQDAPSADPQQARGVYLALMTSQSGKDRTLTQEIHLAEPWRSLWSRKPSTGDSAAVDQVRTASDDPLAWQADWNSDKAMAVLLSRNP